MRNKKLFFSVALGTLITCIAIVVGLITVLKNPVIRAQYYKHSNNPELVVDSFLHALIEDNLDLAKELVIPELRKRIDEWKIASKHKAFNCAWHDLIEPYAWGLGPVITYTNKNKATSGGVSYGCYYDDTPSMSIEGFTLEYDDGEWIITGLKEICESSISSPERCYQ